MGTASEDEAVECTICCSDLCRGELCRRLPCGHMYHSACADRWLLEHHSCPLCRQDIRDPGDIEEMDAQQRPVTPLRVIVALCSGLLLLMVPGWPLLRGFLLPDFVV